MPFAVAVTPKLVRMLDFDGNPADTWVVECPFWLAKYLCDSAQKEGEIFREQQRAFLEQQRLQNPQFSVFYISENMPSGEVFGQLPAIEALPSWEAEHHHFQYSNGEESQETSDFYQSSSEDSDPFGQQDSSSCPFSSQDCYSQTAYSIYEDPSIIHASGDFVPPNPQLLSYPLYDPKSPLGVHQHQPIMESILIPSHGVCSQSLIPREQEFECSTCPPPNWNVFPYQILYPGSGPFIHQDISFEQPSEVSPNFTLQSCDDESSYFTENTLWGVSGYISFSKSEFGFSHPLGQVYKTQRALMCNFTLQSGVTCYVKFFPYCIKFSSNLKGIAYLIDEAGVRTCWESFERLEDEVAKYMWNRSVDSGTSVRGRTPYRYGCPSMACQPRGSGDGTRRVESHVISEGEPVVINRKKMKFYSETCELNNLTLSTEDFFLSATQEKINGYVGHIHIRGSQQRRFRQSAFFNGHSLQVKFHTQSANLDQYGKLSLSK